MKNIDKIMSELYKIDPELKKHEKDLKKVVAKMIQTKPNTKFDKNFAKKLKKQLLSEKESASSKEINFYKSFTYFLSGAVITIIIAVPLTYTLLNFTNNKMTFETKELAQNFKKVGDNAFGPLSVQDMSAGNSLESAPVAGFGGGGMASKTSSYIMPPSGELANYNYVYIGEDLNLEDNDLEVLRKDNTFHEPMIPLLSDLSYDLINLDKLNQLKMRNLDLYEDQDGGYILNINYQNGQVSLSQNWQRLSESEQVTRRIPTIDDVPQDIELINIANNFLLKYGVDTSFYGSPEVDKEWLSYYSKSETDKTTMSYVPDTITVLYPMIVNNYKVYEQGGFITGLRVSINIFNKRVINLSGLETNNYISSNYAAETDSARIIRIAQDGGFSYWQHPEASKIINLNINTPEQIYLKKWDYSSGQEEFLLIPSLVFSVVDDQDLDITRKNIIVPLIKETLDQIEEQKNNNPMVPVPLIEPAAPGA